MDDNRILSDPKDFIHFICRQKGVALSDFPIPQTVFVGISEFFRAFLQQELVEKLDLPFMGNFYTFKNNPTVGLIKSNVGSSAIGVQIEELVAMGVQQIIHLGFAGSLHGHLRPGQFVVTTGALNETGVPQLYGFTEELIPANSELVAKIHERLGGCLTLQSGPHWCTDAPYLETWGKVKHYRGKGALCVEMEGAGVFAVANYHGVPAAAIYLISDVLDENGWTLGWESAELGQGVGRLVEGVYRGFGE